MKKSKIVIIGAGHVGSHCASALTARSLCREIVFIDIDEAKAKSQALDLADSVVFFREHTVVRPGDYSDCKDADIVVVSVGTPPDFNRSRMEYLEETIEMVKTIIDPLKNSGFSGILINISNPADVITHYLQENTGLLAERVISTSTMLDSARLRRIISEKTGIEHRAVSAYSMGEHGASQMVPWSNAAIMGKPLLELMDKQPEEFGKLNLDEVVETTRRTGYDVIHGKGSTEFGIGTALAELAQAILYDEHRQLPVSVLLKGQYGQFDVYASVPAIVGNKGIERIIEIEMTDKEIDLFALSCEAIRKNTRLTKNFL